MECWRLRAKEILFIVLASLIFTLNSSYEIFEYSNFIGWLGTCVSYFYFPAFIAAIIITQKADPPGIIGLFMGGVLQSYLIWVFIKFIRK